MPSIDIVIQANPIVISYVPAATQTIEVKFGAVDSVNGQIGTVVLGNGNAANGNTPIILRKDTAANWASNNPVLRSGEQSLETDTRLKKTGNGVTAYNSLAYDKAPRFIFVSTSGAITLFSDTTDVYTAILVGNTTLSACIGTPYHGQQVVFEFIDNGTSYSFALSSLYRDLTGRVPSSTTINKMMRLGAFYNSLIAKWDIIAFNQEP